MLVHPIPPIYSDTSKILILGSFPSVRSREVGFFYGHPQNRFWKVLAAVLNAPLPNTVDEKKAFLLHHHIALWDVAAACEIQGSADNTIKKVIANDISFILQHADIAQIYANGRTAARYYHQLLEPTVGRAAITLPSTSPANASQSLGDLILAWHAIRDYCQ
jgi:hypoxanthine-DNA glycosylase